MLEELSFERMKNQHLLDCRKYSVQEKNSEMVQKAMNRFATHPFETQTVGFP